MRPAAADGSMKPKTLVVLKNLTVPSVIAMIARRACSPGDMPAATFGSFLRRSWTGERRPSVSGRR